MNFLNPLMLIGLIAASIPVLLHLLNLRKLKTIEFSSLRFLKELQKTKIKRLKIKQIILLILRTAIIAFAVIAFSRPAIKGTIPGFESYAKTSSIILVDNSFSMDLSDEYGNRLNQTKKAVAAILDNMKEGDEAVIIEMANTRNRSQYSFSRNKDLLKEKLSNIKIHNNSANLDKSLSFAGIMLDDAHNYNKEIFIVSDCQSNIFKSGDSARIKDQNIGAYIVPIGINSKSEITNLSIDSLEVVTRIFQNDKPIEVAATIRNNSQKEIKSAVVSMMFNGERVAQRTIDLPANESRVISIAANSKVSGAVRATIELESDALDTDNKRYFGFIVPQKPNVAVIGDFASSTFINLALGGNSGTIANISNFSPANIGGINFNNFDVAILTGGNFRQSDFSRINQFIQSGGSALIFANDETNINELSDGLTQLGFGKVIERKFPDNQKASFSNADRTHPIFEGMFKGSTDQKKLIETPYISKALTAASGISIIDMNGYNFLSEIKSGNGKALYVAVAPTTEWSNFPLTGFFPAFIYRSIYYLTSIESLSSNAELNQLFSINLPKRYVIGNTVKVIDPSGNETIKDIALLPTGAILPIEDFNQPGVYTILNSQGKLINMLSINLPKNESYIGKIEKDNISDEMKLRLDKNVYINFIDDINKISSGITRARTGTELWIFFIFFALLCAAAELIVERVSKNDLGE